MDAFFLDFFVSSRSFCQTGQRRSIASWMELGSGLLELVWLLIQQGVFCVSGCLCRFWNLIDDLASGEEGFFLGCGRVTRSRGTIEVMLPRSAEVLMIQELVFT